jgi:glycosyltransferase involved in cell wall biosynthesis
MRLALYIRSIQSARGAERVAVNLASGLSARGHDIDLLVEEESGWLLDELRAEARGIRIINLRTSAVSRLSQRLLQACSFAIMMADNVRQREKDWCIRPIFDLLFRDNAPIAALLRYFRAAKSPAVLSLLNYPNAVLLIAGRVSRRKPKVVVSVHNTISASTGKGDSRRSRDIPRLMKRLFPLADEIVAPSDGVAHDVAAIARVRRDRISMIYNPVVGPSLLAQAAAEAGHPWLTDGDIPTIVAAGKLKRQKDFPTLLRAFARIQKAVPSRLIILGEGPERASLLDLAEELGFAGNVSLPGQVRNPYVYYRRAAVFVLSSEWEGLPTVLIEAMACGCPVVSTACPNGPREILDDGRFGPLVPVGDHIELAKAVLDTLANPLPKERLIERARCFSIEEAALRYDRLMTGTSMIKTRAICGGGGIGDTVSLRNSHS